MNDPADAETRAYIDGKLAWLDYLTDWIRSHPLGGHGAIQAAWADFQDEHPEIANGPGFVRREGESE